MTIALDTPTRVSTSALTQLRDRVSMLEAQIGALQETLTFLRTGIGVVDDRVSDADVSAKAQIAFLYRRIELQDATIRELHRRLESYP